MASDRKELLRIIELAQEAGDDALESKALRKLDGLGSKVGGPVDVSTKFNDLPPTPPPFDGFQPKQPEASLRGIGSQALSGVNEGLADMFGLPVDAVSSALRASGVDAPQDSFGGSASIRNLFAPAIGAESQVPSERISRRVGQELGAAAIPGVGLSSRAASPARFLASEAGLSALGGGAAGITAEAGGGELAQLAASIGSPLGAIGAATGAKALTRGALRGGEGGRQQVVQNIEDFNRAGTDPAVGQALNKTPGGFSAQMLTTGFGNTPGGQGVPKRFSENQSSKIERKVREIADKISPRQDTEIAGLTVKRGIEGKDGVVDRFKARGAQLYNKAATFIPPFTPTRVSNSVEYLKDKIAPIVGATNISNRLANSTLKGILKDFRADAVQGNIPYEALKAIRSRVGNLMIDGPFEDFSRRDLKGLYAAMSEDIFIQAKNAGPEAEKAARHADEFWKNGMQRYEDVLEKIAGKSTPEDIFKAFKKGDDKFSVIRTVMRALKPNERDVVASTLLSQLGRKTSGAADNFGEGFSTDRFLTGWNDIGKKSRRLLFSSKNAQQYVKDLDALAATADNIKSGSRVLANASGTAARGANIAAIGTAAVGTATLSPLVVGGVAGGMLAANFASRMLTSQRVVRFLARSTKWPKERLLVEGARFAEKLDDPELQTAFNAYLEVIRGQ